MSAFRIKSLLLAVVWLLAGTAFALPGDGQLVDRIVAVVNDDVVTLSELENATNNLRLQLSQRGSSPSESALRKKALDSLIDLKLQLAVAEHDGMEVKDQTVADAISSIAQRNGLSIGQLRDALAADGIDFVTFRERLRRQLLIKRLHATKVVNRIQVTKEEVDEYLKQEQQGMGADRQAVRVSHILIALPENATPAQMARAEAKAERLMTELRQGGDFAGLAQAQSDGRNAPNGGDLGWLTAEQIPSLFAEVIAELQVGELAGPIKSSSGFHIVKLTEAEGGERTYVEQTHARHILIKTNEIVADEDARIRLDQLRQRIEGGEDFANLARSNSEDQGSAIRGGDLDWVNPGDLVPQFEQVMNSLEPGQLSEPFRTQFGWHIVQVLERRIHDSTEERLRAEARAAIRGRKAEDAIREYQRQLRAEAYIEIHLDDQYADQL